MQAEGKKVLGIGASPPENPCYYFICKRKQKSSQEEGRRISGKIRKNSFSRLDCYHAGSFPVRLRIGLKRR